jgi:signal transduction histidine kinase
MDDAGAALPRLRVLLIEDDETDALLLLRKLSRAYDIVHERIETFDGLHAALDRQAWDLVVSDYTMPAFDAPRALAIIRDRQLDVPFIIVSGTVDEVTAVASMRAGAHDFIAKGKLARLLPAVEREIREAAIRAERKRMHEELLVSDRMASLGTLAAGVAHEINNPLAAVLANLDVVLVDLEDAVAALRHDGVGVPASPSMDRLVRSVEGSLQALRECREASIRVWDVSRDLKVFSRSTDERRSPVDIERVLDSSLRLARTEIRHRARIVREYAPVPAVAANETRLGQLFLNLLVNAAHAIPEGAADRHEIRVATRCVDGDRVVVEVQDTGRGIPADVLPHIFDPFFTTKPIGVGTGLGLAICHRVITELGGQIGVETHAGVGTTFRVTLPVAVGLAPEAVSAPPVVAPTRRRGRVLILDDDELVLNAARRIVGPHHDVVTSVDAREMLERIAAGERFDVVLCDVQMPNVSGMEFFTEVAASAPEQAARIIFMTGGAFTAAARDFLDTTSRPCLEKPFDAARLLDVLESSLRERPAGAG